jgi:HEAT repeat protein
MPKQKIAAMLEGADHRSIGRANEVVRLVLREPLRFHELIKCLWDENPLVRMRAADAAEKVSVEKPRLLDRYKAELLGMLVETEQIELRWHLAQMVPRLRLTALERQRAVAVLQRYLDDRSSIVKTCALQGLADLAQNDAGLRGMVKQLLEESVQSGTPAMKARARKLLKKLPA